MKSISYNIKEKWFEPCRFDVMSHTALATISFQDPVCDGLGRVKKKEILNCAITQEGYTPEDRYRRAERIAIKNELGGVSYSSVQFRESSFDAEKQERQ